jgi:nitrogen fixation protein FixH
MTTTFEIRGWHVLATLLGFFAVIIAVNVVFAVAAVRTFPGEDVRRSYLQGLRYNDVLARRESQASLGWTATATLLPSGSAGVVEITLADAAGHPLDGATVTGALQRPTDARLDRPLVFEAAGAGRYRAIVNDAPPGRWRLRAQAQRGAPFEFEADLQWSPR